MTVVRCLVGDTSVFFAEGLTSVLEGSGAVRVVHRAEDPDELVRLAAESQPDIVLACFEPPALSTDVARRVRCAPVFQLTWSNRDFDLVEALRAGMRGYARKDIDVHRLGRMIRAVVEGDLAMPDGWERSVLAHLDGQVWAHRRTEPVQLTSRQRDVVQLAVDGCSNKAIALALGIKHQTAKNHLRDTMSKVGVSSRVQLCLWALEHGFDARAVSA